MEVDIGVLAVTVTACCILHNFCELQSERGGGGAPVGEVLRPLAARHSSPEPVPQPTGRANTANNPGDVRDMRDAIHVQLVKDYPLRRSSFR